MPNEETSLVKKSPQMAITERGFSPATMEEAWSYANRLAKTQFIPQTYQGKPEDCFIAIDISARLGVHPMMFLQNSYIVHGRPAMEAKLILSLVNGSGLFTDPLDYEVEGNDPSKSDYRVRAFATRVSTGKTLYGPWITWKLVKGEKWDSKQGSKWQTMPEVMFHYRAASWFTNRHCPEVKMGLMGIDEANEDAHRKHVESTELPAQTRSKFGPRTTAPTESDPGTDAPAKDEAEPTAETATEGENAGATEGSEGADPTTGADSQNETQESSSANTSTTPGPQTEAETDPLKLPDNIDDLDKPTFVCTNKKCKQAGVVTTDVISKVVQGKPVNICKKCIGQMDPAPKSQTK